jgi:predicted GNAT family N-acyltransferase
MQFNLSTGVVDKTTKSLVSRRHVNSLIELFEREPPLSQITPEEQATLISLYDEMGWIEAFDGYSDQNKL